jgi:hypothetical protein
MVPLSAGGPGIFPSFFQKEAETLVEEFEPGEEEAQAVPVVPLFHFFQGLETTVQQDVEVRRPPQAYPALGTVQVVGRDDVGTTGTEANFHKVSLGQREEESKSLFAFPLRLGTENHDNTFM